MIQNIVIILILAACAWFIGRRFCRTFRDSGRGNSCGCGCSGCDPKTASTCHQAASGSDPE